MPDLKEWQCHIADQHEDNKGKAWCGVGIFGFRFTSVDHAAMAGRNGDRLTPCPQCLAAVITALNHETVESDAGKDAMRTLVNVITSQRP